MNLNLFNSRCFYPLWFEYVDKNDDDGSGGDYIRRHDQCAVREDVCVWIQDSGAIARLCRHSTCL